jgi:hypothetical protein
MIASNRLQQLEGRKRWAYQKLYEFTAQCQLCAITGCACKDSICQHVQEQAKAKGISLPIQDAYAQKKSHLRFVGASGCVVPPHLRETCTIYLCEPTVNKLGFDQQRYSRLKNLCARIDWKLMELHG